MNVPKPRRPTRRTAVVAGLSILAVAAALAVGATLLEPTGDRPASAHRVGPLTPRTATTVLRMPVDADCTGCHVTEDGVIGVNPIPAIAHPVDGWRDCTACHTAGRLVTPAPGHDGIGSTVCVTCHTVWTPAGPLRPHSLDRVGACLTCHGSARAHLPDSMLDRADDLCWLCHPSVEMGALGTLAVDGG